MNPFQVVQDFESALCEYTGAPYAVTTTSCTMALLLAISYRIDCYDHLTKPIEGVAFGGIEIPKHTYIGVAMSIIHAGGWPTFREEDWSGSYQLVPLPIWDSARHFTSGMYAGRILANNGAVLDCAGVMLCVSFHWNKTLGIQQGGAILHDNPEADKWLRKARFDGRTEGVAPADDIFDVLGWHCYMSPETAAQGLVRLANLPKHNEPLPNDDYPDLSQLEIFK